MSEGKKDGSRFDLVRTPAPGPVATHDIDAFVQQVEATTQISVRLPSSLVKTLRVYLAQTEVKQQDLIKRLLEDHLRQQGVL